MDHPRPPSPVPKPRLHPSCLHADSLAPHLLLLPCLQPRRTASPATTPPTTPPAHCQPAQAIHARTHHEHPDETKAAGVQNGPGTARVGARIAGAEEHVDHASSCGQRNGLVRIRIISSSRGRRLSSIPPSVSSLEQVAFTRAFDNAYRDRDREPPPMHPDRTRTSALPSIASASSGGQSSPERGKPRSTLKPRSLTSAVHSQSPFDAPAPTPQTQMRLTHLYSHSLQPMPAPSAAASAAPKAGRVCPESVHALLGSLGGALRLGGGGDRGGKLPFGDPAVRGRRSIRGSCAAGAARRIQIWIQTRRRGVTKLVEVDVTSTATQLL